MGDKFLGLLGICRKAGKLTTGAAKTTELIKQGRAEAVFIACDLSAKTEKELRFTANKNNTAVVRTPYSIEQLSAAVGIPTGVLGISDNGFATALNKLIVGGSLNDD